jgi:hypothetical protein
VIGKSADITEAANAANAAAIHFFIVILFWTCSVYFARF